VSQGELAALLRAEFIDPLRWKGPSYLWLAYMSPLTDPQFWAPQRQAEQ
jgi:hypothetical protein